MSRLRVCVVVTWVFVGFQCSGIVHFGPFGVRAALCLVTALSAVTALFAAAGWSGRSRAGLLLLGLGISCYAAGFLVLFLDAANQKDGVLGVNLSDCISLFLYPLAYTGLVVLTQARHERRDWAALFEGAMVATGAAAVAVAVVVRMYPSLLRGSPLRVVYDLAYPVGGFTLLVCTVAGIALGGWRVDRLWGWLAAGFFLMTVGDGFYGLRAAAHTFRFGTWSELLYTAGPVGVAVASSMRPTAATRAPARPAAAMTVPALATLTALGVLVADHFITVPTAAVVLAATCGVLAVGRTGLYLRQGRVLAHTRALAHTDELTGLPNRRALLQQLRAVSATPRPHALLLIDLDGFKDVNDAFGHAAGDALLQTVAARLLAAAGSSPVCRLGGDEFAILHPGSIEAAQALAVTIGAELREPAEVSGARVTVDASVGVGQLPTHAVDDAHVGEALRRADVALYRAKNLRTRVEVWEPSLDAELHARLTLVADLRRAVVSEEELVAFFQPQTDSQTGQILGFEALVRWQHPRRGLLAPSEFLETARSEGLLPAITQIMLRQSLSLLAARRPVNPGLRVSVNLSAGDLLDDSLPNTIMRMLHEFGVPVASLVLEVTESIVLSDPERMMHTLEELSALGVGLALDDYGTGLSSLSHLRRLPLNELKIDRSVVTNIATDPADLLIVRSTIALAHSLRLTVVAEGVETQDAADLLANMRCEQIQGWLTGRPMPAKAAAAALDEARRQQHETQRSPSWGQAETGLAMVRS